MIVIKMCLWYINYRYNYIRVIKLVMFIANNYMALSYATN